MKPRKALLSVRSSIGGRNGFNEAEAMKPRKGRIDIDAADTPERFNEAEAMKPRKARSASRSCRRLGRFNEAEAMKPRKAHGQ